MEIVRRCSSYPLNRQLAFFAVLASAFLILLALLYRSFWHYDVVITSSHNPAGTVRMLERLEALDADYRVQKDGTIFVQHNDAALLMQEGIPFTDTQAHWRRLLQVAMVLLCALTAVLAVNVGRGIYTTWKASQCMEPANETAVPEAAKQRETAPPEPIRKKPPFRKRFDAKLFEQEHPQTVAVYLLGLEVEKAAAAMETIEAPLRDRVWERMAFSGECDITLRRRVAELFSDKLHTLRKRMRPDEVTEKMVAIFQRLSPGVRDELIMTLRRGHSQDEILTLLETENIAALQRKEA